ncbi:MAG: trypsin-like peptidase domain-containing protein [Rubrivivax sp.]
MFRPPLLLFLAGVLAAGTAAAAPEPSVFVALAASVLRIEAPRAEGGFALGSAVSVAPELVVTNCHVTRLAREVSVVRGGVRWQADLQAAELERDLCLLHVPGLKADPVPLADSGSLAPGQSVTALGYTGGIGIQNSRGEVTDLHRFGGARVIQSSNWFSSGASGGGLFDDRGRLVGVLTFRLRGGERHYYAAPAEWVRQLLDGAAHGDLRPVLPLEAYPTAYWEAAAPPYFLRAAVLQRDGRWAELAALVGEWSHQDAEDGEPWFLLGQALQRLGRAADARQAYACSLRLAPERPAARDALAALGGASADNPRSGCAAPRPG